MQEIKVALVSEGSSDRILCPILRWLFSHHVPNRIFNVRWADLAYLNVRTESLAEKIKATLEYFPSRVVCVHRDADSTAPKERALEIQRAVDSAQLPTTIHTIPVIPVRMTEAWLMFDEQAIRTASGNTKGRMPLALPKLADLESIRTPKETLYNALKTASGRTGRFLKTFHPQKNMHRIPDYIQDYSPLLALPAFKELSSHISRVARNLEPDR